MSIDLVQLCLQLVAIADQAAGQNTFARPLEGGLRDQRQGQGGQLLLDLAMIAGKHGPVGGRHSGGPDESLGAVLIERYCQGQRVGTGVGNSQHLEHGRHARLARAAAAGAFGEIEHQIGSRPVEQTTQERLAVAEQIELMPQVLQHRGQGVYGLGRVELLVVIPQAGQALWAGRERAGANRQSGRAAFRANIERHPDAHCGGPLCKESGVANFVTKKPMGRSPWA